MIPTEDFTDMTLVSEDTEAHDCYDGPGVLHEKYVAQFQTNLSWVWHHNLGVIVDCSFGGGAMSFVRWKSTVKDRVQGLYNHQLSPKLSFISNELLFCCFHL